MRATQPRPQPNFRELLEQTPGWYVLRATSVAYRSEAMLKESKRFQLWLKAGWWDEPGTPGAHIVVNYSDDYWFYCGNGPEPLSPWGATIAS